MLRGALADFIHSRVLHLLCIVFAEMDWLSGSSHGKGALASDYTHFTSDFQITDEYAG